MENQGIDYKISTYPSKYYLVTPDDWPGIKAFYKKVDKEDKENGIN
jgi:hypothetical protein